MTEEEQINQRLVVLTALTAAQIQHGGVKSVGPDAMATLGMLAGALVYTNRKNQQVFSRAIEELEAEESHRREAAAAAAEAAAQHIFRKMKGGE